MKITHHFKFYPYRELQWECKISDEMNHHTPHMAWFEAETATGKTKEEAQEKAIKIYEQCVFIESEESYGSVGEEMLKDFD